MSKKITIKKVSEKVEQLNMKLKRFKKEELTKEEKAQLKEEFAKTDTAIQDFFKRAEKKLQKSLKRA